MRLSATYHPIDFLLLHYKKWIPGAVNIQAVYNKSNRVHYFDGETYTHVTMSDLQSVHFLKLRQRKTRFTWGNADFFSADITSISSSQLTMDKELDNHFLALFIPNSTDQLSDIILIEFPQHVNPFKLKNATINLTTDDKENVGAVLHGVFCSEYERVSLENKLLQAYRSGMENLQSELERTKNELTILKENIQRDFTATLEFILAQILVEEHVRLEILPETISLLTRMKLSDQNLKSTLLNALNLELINQSNSDTVQISPHFIEAQSNSESISFVNEKYDKTMLLLNRYEAAAQELTRAQIPVNGKHVADRLHITPPALTDAVKKNATKITVLLENYPKKWTLIRQYLKPIRRIDDAFGKSA